MRYVIYPFLDLIGWTVLYSAYWFSQNSPLASRNDPAF